MNISPKLSLILAMLLGSTLVSSVYGSESATPSAEPEQVTESIKNRLKETINAVDISSENSPIVGYVGKIKDLVKNTLVIEDKSGKRNVIVDDATTIVRSPGNANIKLENIRIGDAVIVMGLSTDNSETKGKRLIVSDTPFNPPSKVTGMARIAKVTSISVTLATIPVNESLVLTMGPKSQIKSTAGSLELSDLKNGDQVIYSALVDPKDPSKLTATVIMRVKDSMPDRAIQTPSGSPKVTSTPK